MLLPRFQRALSVTPLLLHSEHVQRRGTDLLQPVFRVCGRSGGLRREAGICQIQSRRYLTVDKQQDAVGNLRLICFTVSVSFRHLCQRLNAHRTPWWPTAPQGTKWVRPELSRAASTLAQRQKCARSLNKWVWCSRKRGKKIPPGIELTRASLQREDLYTF